MGDSPDTTEKRINNGEQEKDEKEEIIKDYENKIFVIYEDKSKNFWKTFSIVIGFSFFLFFLILLPFIFLQEKIYELTQDIKEKEKEIEHIENNISTYKEIIKKFDNLENAIDKGSQDIRNYINSFKDTNISINSSSSESERPRVNTYSNCKEPQNINNIENKNSWIFCNTLHVVAIQFHNFTLILEYEIYPLVSNVNEPSVNEDITILQNNLINFLLELNNTLTEKIFEDPEFIKYLDQKEDFYGIVGEKVWTFKEDYVLPLNASLNTALNKTISEKNNTESKIIRFNHSRNELENRLEEVEFPFGKIPIGINELVAIFPLTLAIGFAIYSYLIGDTIKSRKVIHNYYDEKNKNLDELQLNRKVSSIAPLWIDPVNYNRNISLKFLILIIPFVIFIFSLYLIFDSWTKTDQINMETIFPYNIELYKQFYIGIYIFSFGFFIYGIARIVYEFLNYSIKKS